MTPSPIEIRESTIHGRGVFATRLIRIGQWIGPRGIYRRTGFNHSCVPNVKRMEVGPLVANREIQAGEELTLSYPGWHMREELQITCRCPNCKGK